MCGWKSVLEKEILNGDDKTLLCHELLTEEPDMERMILKFFTEDDFREIAERRIGRGQVGGKACGLLLSRKLIEVRMPGYLENLEPHHSFFIGADTFEDYLELNGCGEMQSLVASKDRTELLEKYEGLLLGGRFSEEVREQIGDVLRHYDEEPLIIRSSSIMEDGFGHAFSGKYESVFCSNQGIFEERLEEMLAAVRRVYASVFTKEALEYRKRHELLEKKEKMGILIQRAAGRRIGDFYFPIAGGMGCSYNPYKWAENLNPEAGMIRMVAGFGTRAVERTPGDYPRLVSLDHAKANIRTTVADRHKFSQRKVDVIDLKEKKMVTVPIDSLFDKIPHTYKKLVLSRDTDAEGRLAQRRIYRKIYFADCQGLVDDDDFIEMVRSMEKVLEKTYRHPVDLEFAVTMAEDGGWRINLLQCRPMRMTADGVIHIPEGIDHEILFDIRRTSISYSREISLDYIVWVDPQRYYEYEYHKKPEVATLLGRINAAFEGMKKNIILLVPGRIGTSSPELGVPVLYCDIHQFCAVCEVAYSKVGYNPELSYGSHMFQDLVEADIYYGAINENSKTRIFAPEILKKCNDVLGEFLENEKDELREIVQLYDVTDRKSVLMLDAKEGRAVCRVCG